MENTDVWLDLNGYPMNFKYQPDVAKYGSEYCGYKSWNEEAFFYEFAVQNYDLSFRYKGKMYYLMRNGEKAVISDEHFSKEYVVYPSANQLIENMDLDGEKLIDVMGQLEDVEIW